MITQLGKKVLLVSSLSISFGVFQHYAYYSVLYSFARENFLRTSLEEKPNLSEPVLIVHEDSKFVFAHRGGKTAVESVLNDTFTKNRQMRRAIVLQVLTVLSITIGVVKNRAYILPVAFTSIVGNIAYEYPIVASGVKLYHLSALVKEGNKEVWENLNEARYAQRLEEIYSPQYVYSRMFGTYGTLSCIFYMTPILGCFITMTGAFFSWHKKYQ